MSEVANYIAEYPEPAKSRLTTLYDLAKQVAPMATEHMSWGMPTFKVNGKNAFHFAKQKHHIGFYPSPEAIEQFAPELADYKTSKGAVQFPDDKPLPIELITRIMTSRVQAITGS